MEPSQEEPLSTFTVSRWCLGLKRSAIELEGPRPEEEVDYVPFVRLEPVDARRGDGADVQAVDVDGTQKCPLKGCFLGKCRAHKGRANSVEHLFLGAFH